MPADPSNSADAAFTFSSPNGGVTFECQLDGGGFAPCASPKDYVGLSDGLHVFDVRAVDLAGNVDPTPAAYAWLVDTFAPDTQIDSMPANPSNSADASFTFSSPDGGTTFACQLDGGGFAPCVSPANYFGLGDGPHTFEVRASDAAGNTDPTPALYGWTIDTLAPTVLSVTLSGTSPTNAAKVDFTVTFSESVSGVDETDFTLTASGVTGAAVFAVNGFWDSYTVTVDTGSGDGSLRLDVLDDDTITDKAGNPLNGGFTAGQSYTIDKTAPDTQIDTMPADPSTSPDATFTFSSPDGGLTFDCQLDGGGFGPCTSPVNYFGLGDGPHTFEVRSTDAAGNTDPSPASYAWDIDATAPTVVSVNLLDPDPTNAASVDFSVTFSESVSGVDKTDFAVTASGVTGAAVSGVSGGPLTYTVTVNTGSGDGTLRLDVLDDDTIRDASNNPLNGGYTTGGFYTVDKTAPDTQIDTMPANPSNSPNAAFTFSSPDATAAFECQLDGGGFAPCTSPANYPGLGDGPHTFEVRAFDQAGNTDPSPAVYGWTIDTLAPDTQIDTMPTDPSTSPDATFTFSSPDGGTSFACRLDGGVFDPCTSPLSFFSLTNGPHTFEVRASDAAGNVDPTPASYTWNIDATAPTVLSVNLAGTSPTNAASVGFTVTFSEPVSGVDETDFTVTASGVTAAAVTSVSGGPTIYTVTVDTGSGDGTLRLDVLDDDSIRDASNNPLNGGFTAGQSYTVDKTAPDTQIDSMPADPTNSRDASFTFSSPDGGLTFECQIDGGGFGSCASPANYSSLADGPHTFEVRSTDAAGNVDPSPASTTWNIDATPPDTQIDTTPPNPSNSANAAFTFSSPDGGLTFECQLDGGGFGACASPKDYTGLPDGLHTFEVRAADALGNTDPTPASYTWLIDTAAPDTQIDTKPADPSNSADAAFTFSSNDLSATFQCQLDGSGFAPCASPANYSSLADGPHTFDVRAVDLLNNVDPSPATYTWTIDTVAPNTQVDTHPTDPSNSPDASFTFSSPDGGIAFECQLDGGGFGACTSPKNYTGLENGVHTFEVRSTDAAGNPDATPASFTWSLDTGLPFVTSILRANGSPTELPSVDFTVTFTKPVTGVDVTDFTPVITGLSGVSVTGVSGSGTTYTVSVDTGTGDGTLRLDLLDDDSIGDIFGNKLGGPGTGNGDYTTGEVYTIRKPVTVTLRSQAGYDGWILERGQYSSQGGTVDAAATTLILGDNASNSQYRSILSFNTAGLPNKAIISRVTLKIKRQSIVGTNPFLTHKKLVVDIKNSPFSGANSLVPTDFEDTADMSAAALFSNTPSYAWYSVDLKATAFQYINLTGITQFRLRFQMDDNNDLAADNILFFSGNALLAERPTLIIEYYMP
jgi:hypothetical protein